MGWRDHFEQHGYVVLPSLLNIKVSRAIDSAVNPVFDSWFTAHQADIKQYGMVNMHSLTQQQYFSADGSVRVDFFNAITADVLVKTLTDIFGTGLYFHNTQLFFNPLDQHKLPYWHRDMQYDSIDESVFIAEQKNLLSLHVRIPLVAERGVELVPGSHNRWDSPNERQVRLELNGHHNTEPLPGAELISLEVGDVLVFDAQMLHRGNYALNETRRALDLCVGKPHPLTATHLDPKVLPNAEELQQINNPEWFLNAADVINNDPCSA